MLGICGRPTFTWATGLTCESRQAQKVNGLCPTRAEQNHARIV